jgi:O-antigen/teichoic acid export membrane protein
MVSQFRASHARATMTVRFRRVGFPVAPALFRQAGIYTVSNIIVRAIPFLLLPVLTRYLSPADYGIVAMFFLTVVILEPFVSVTFAGAITVKFYDKATDLPAYVGTGAVLVIVVGALFALLLFLIRDPLSAFTSVPSTWLLLVVPFVVARSIGAALPALLRVREKAILYAMLQIGQSAAIISLSLLFVILLGRSWPGRLEAELLVTLLFAVGAVVALWRSGWLRPVFVPQYSRHLATFGVPLILHTLGWVLMTQSNRLLVTNYVGLEETGLFTVGFQLALVIELFAGSFNNAYTPWLYRKLTDADEQTKLKLVKYTYIQFAAMGLLAAAVAVVMPLVAGFLLDRSFAGAGRYIGWFALGFMFSGMYYMVTNYIFYAQRTAWLAAVTFAVAVFNLPLTYVLIQANGGIGAAQATAISLGLSFLFTWIVSQRVYPMPWLGAISGSATRT